MNVADICPVGALTTKDFRFKIRVWFLDDVPGVCTGCANGCNVHLGVANNQVYRYVPRRNDAVNETWICDEGRMSYKRIGAAGPPRRDAAAAHGRGRPRVGAARRRDRRRGGAVCARSTTQGRRRGRGRSPRRTRPTRISFVAAPLPRRARHGDGGRRGADAAARTRC